MLDLPLRPRLSERPTCKSGFSLSRARHLWTCLSCLGKRRDPSGRHRQSPTFVPTKSLQNSCFIGRAWPKSPVFIEHFEKVPTKMFLRHRCRAVECNGQPGLYYRVAARAGRSRMLYKAVRSAGGIRRPLRLLRKEKYKYYVKRTEVHD